MNEQQMIRLDLYPLLDTSDIIVKSLRIALMLTSVQKMLTSATINLSARIRKVPTNVIANQDIKLLKQ